MKYYADLHIHSRFSRATSSDLTPGSLDFWARKKGIALVGTGDATHPEWLAELAANLDEPGDGFLTLKPSSRRPGAPDTPYGAPRFVLTAEISNIYKRDGAVRKVHNVLCLPTLDAARRLQTRLEAIGNIRSDGRPILGLDSRDLLEIALENDPKTLLIPAHIWTPWFSALGSKSGFESIQQCYADLAKHVYAVETGLSSDPPMNWRLSSLDPFVLVSSSDAHSPSKLGRELTVFDTDMTYEALYRALADPDDPGLTGTMEFFPDEGKYHYDGHRKCDTRLHPRDTIANKGLCPVCGKPVTVGVMARVEQLADRSDGEKGARWRPFTRCIPLAEIIGDAEACGPATKKAVELYERLVAQLQGELPVLIDAPIDRIGRIAGPVVAEGVRRMREGTVHIDAGYDGEFGVVRLFTPQERSDILKQTTLFETAPARRRAPKTAQPTAVRGAPAVEKPAQAETAPAAVNSRQEEAIAYDGGHLLIVAGPGTGKTFTLTRRIARLARTLDGGQMAAAVTFTNKAAQELAGRLAGLCTPEESARVTTGTFHSFCLGLLRQHGTAEGLRFFTVATPDVVEQVAARLLCGLAAKKRSEALAAVSRWKSAPQSTRPPEHAAALTAALRDAGLLDFDDILYETWRLLQADAPLRASLHETCRHIFVDEYQDVNEIQHGILRLLCGDGCAVTVIGDPDQAIYGFRGSSSAFFRRFTEEFTGARTVNLADNYRSAAALLEASGQLIRRGRDGSAPALVARFAGEGRLVISSLPTDKAEAEFITHQIEKLVGGTAMFSHDSDRVDSHGEASRSFGDIAVLYRLNQQADAIEEAFDRLGIPCQVAGRKPPGEDPLLRAVGACALLAAGMGAPLNDLLLLLRHTVDGFGDSAASVLSALWWNSPAVRLEQLAEPAGRKDLPAACRNGLRELAEQIAGLKNTVQPDGTPAAALLGFLSTNPRFTRWCDTSAESAPALARIGGLARLHPDLARFADALALRDPADECDMTVEKVHLMSLHAAKGLEFPVVFIAGCEQGLLPLSQESLAADPDEERRLFYVGMTRAKELLFLTRAEKRALFGRSRSPAPSPFLADIEETLKSYEARGATKKRKRKAEAEQLSLF